jgi:penicillin V acylase-like amidase (Ntn superfamily)
MTKNEALIHQAVSDAMGKEVIIREIRGKIVVSDKPEFKKRVLTEKQELVTDTMREANDYAKWHMSEEQLRNAAQIRLNVTRQRLYTALVSEYWKNHWVMEKSDL